MSGYAFVEGEKAASPVTRLCRVLGVSPSGSWAWRKRIHQREPSVRATANAQLQEQRMAIHPASRATYGAPRIHADLSAQGVRCGRRAGRA